MLLLSFNNQLNNTFHVYQVDKGCNMEMCMFYSLYKHILKGEQDTYHMTIIAMML